MKNFEEKLERLEAIDEDLRVDTIQIEKSMQIFEEGIKIARTLQKDLEKMERKVEILVNTSNTPDEKPVMELFPELED